MVAGPVGTDAHSAAGCTGSPAQLSSFVDSLIFRIDGDYYDLTDFSASHPGGSDILIWFVMRALQLWMILK